MSRATAEDLRRRLVGGSESGLPRRQALALAREAIEALAAAESEIAGWQDLVGSDDPLAKLVVLGDAVAMRGPVAGGSIRG